MLNQFYDPNGMRYKKVVNGATTNYYYSGTQLLMEDRVGGLDRIYYIYGASGISGMVCRSGYTHNIYYFDKNTLGDIVAIRNPQGNVVARYTYDAWGNHTVYNANGTTDTNQSSIGNVNPFRYRGYYYDTETGFYYLQTRYYDPTICRFINADNYELVADLASSMQLNMYAYCGNNPVMGKQSSISSGGSIATSSILVGALASVIGTSGGGLSGNPSAGGLSTVVGAIPDFILGMKYLAASGMHSKFAYATNTRYMHPIMGGTWRWFGKSSSNFGTVAQGSLKQILTGDAKAGFGAIAKSVGGVVVLNGIINFGFNLYENNWQIDSAMLKDTAIDTAIAASSYYLAAGTMSLITACAVTSGVVLPGIVVVGGVVILSIGFEHTIRAIFDYWY